MIQAVQYPGNLDTEKNFHEQNDLGHGTSGIVIAVLIQFRPSALKRRQ
jgi:hypothetical protein